MKNTVISLFIFDWSDYKLLLQRKIFKTYNSESMWANTLFSDCQKDEALENVLNDQLKTKFKYNTTVQIADPNLYGLLLNDIDTVYDCGSNTYDPQYKITTTHEIHHLLLYSPAIGGLSKSEFVNSLDEIQDYKWITIPELKLWMNNSPSEFAPWFKNDFEQVYTILCRQARNMDMFFSQY